MNKTLFTIGLSAVLVWPQSVQAGDIRNYYVQMTGRITVTGHDTSYQPVRTEWVSAAGYITEAESIRTYELGVGFIDDGIYRGEASNATGGVFFSGWEELSPYTRSIIISSNLTINGGSASHGRHSRMTGNPVISADGIKLTIPFEILASPVRPRVSYVVEFDLRPDFFPGDSNGDCVIDINDLNAVRNDFGKMGPELPSDLDKDNTVGISDLNLVRNNFGKRCEAGAQTIVKRSATLKKDRSKAR